MHSGSFAVAVVGADILHRRHRGRGSARVCAAAGHDGSTALITLRNRSILVQALLVLLVLAQGLAHAHAYAHLRAGPRDDGTASGSRLCAECCLSAALAHAVGTHVAAAPNLAPPLPGPPPCLAAARPEPRGFSAFRSRAPPTIP